VSPTAAFEVCNVRAIYIGLAPPVFLGKLDEERASLKVTAVECLDAFICILWIESALDRMLKKKQ